ncbi:Pkinase-domain-containing protein [Exidia glandulosa HHB12029]|uniref:non-specific serine/threonine protein kinase n=1 Tax=Exidia glandulosa HHB12029 TaxID=1314781 RepID=A0A165BI54_EXIGL|nr:Pkinase-domain-containing protein [Exidia glandulosa HHB12029]
MAAFPEVGGYVLRERIGGGGFSEVYKAVNYTYNVIEACKVVYLTNDTSVAQRKDLDKEIRVQAALKHINVVSLIDKLIVEPNADARYISGVYMLMEFAHGGDLFDKIAPDVGVSEDIAHEYIQQLVAGVSYIHSIGVAHRDLKPENILLSKDGTLKVSDFGLCAVYRHKDKTRQLTERCGSLPYVAPELDGDQPYDAEPVDVWGIGVILFTLLVGNTPWDEPTGRSHEFVRYARGEIFQDDPWNRIKPTALDLLTRMLTIDPHKRITLAEIAAHHWFLRKSQISNKDPFTRAEMLTEGLRRSGDMEIANPDFAPIDSDAMEVDTEDARMAVPMASQFTQGLQLFSQTQTGRRYVQQLTRFYASIPPDEVKARIIAALTSLPGKIKYQERPAQHPVRHVLRVGGYDARREPFKGFIDIEEYNRPDMGKISYIVFKRDVGNPISWKQLFRALVYSPELSPVVCRKQR